MSRRTLLSAEQRARLFAIPTEPAEMIRHYALGGIISFWWATSLGISRL